MINIILHWRKCVLWKCWWQDVPASFGSHLIDALLEEGHQVVYIDNFFIGTDQGISHLKKNPHFKFYQKDLSVLSAIFTQIKIRDLFSVPGSIDFLISKLLNHVHALILEHMTLQLILTFSAIISKILVTPITMISNFILMKGVIEKL